VPESGGALDKDASAERKRYRGLLEITDLVARAKSLPDAFKEFAPPVLALTGGELLNVSLHDPRRDCMLTQYWKKNQESGEFDVLPVEEAATGWVWKHQELIAIPDTEREQRFPGFVPVLLNHGVRSYIALPVSTPTNHFGALGLGKNLPGSPNDDDIELLSRVALMGALVLEKDRAYSAFEEQQSLVAISRELSSSWSWKSCCRRFFPVCGTSRATTGPFWACWTRMARTCTYMEMLGSGNLMSTATLRFRLSKPSRRAIQTRKVALFTADDLREMKAPLAKAMYELGIRSVCSVPLIAGSRVWGALNPSSKKENAFGPAEVEYLQQVANQIAAALQNAHAYREIAQLKERLARRNAIWSPKSGARISPTISLAPVQP
jgi:formate hydrogenlyase transcriptional activator